MKQQPQRRRRRAPKREEVSTTHVRKGIFCLMILLGVVSFCAVAGMLVKLMLVDHDYYEAKAIRNQTRSTSVTASRGTIYDRNGNVLAASSSVENVFLDPLELSQNKVDVPALAKKLAAVLELDAGWIEEQAADTSLRYKVIKRRQAQEVCDKVREIIAEDKIIGVHLEPDSQRYYPYHDVAAHHNATGMGNADVTTRRLFDKIDMEQTYPNSLTSRDINGFRIPIVMENDDLAIRFALHTITGANAGSGYRAMWIRDTNHVQTFYVTERLLADTAAMPWLRTDGVALRPVFGADGYFTGWERA